MSQVLRQSTRGLEKAVDSLCHLASFLVSLSMVVSLCLAFTVLWGDVWLSVLKVVVAGPVVRFCTR